MYLVQAKNFQTDLPVCQSDFTSCPCDHVLDPMTSIYKTDLDIMKKYQHTKNELSRSMFSKVRALQTDKDRETAHRHMPLNTLPHCTCEW